MQLKSFGCSFIFGSDLADTHEVVNTPSKLTWPALLAKHLKYSYSCHARPGSGNLQIAEKVLIQANNNDNDLYVINWSWIDRFDYYNSNHTGITWQDWSTIMPVDSTDLAKIYYRDLHSEYQDKLTTLMLIKLVIDTLKQKGIPFLMTYMDNLIFDQEWHTTPAVIDLQNYIKPYMTSFNDQTFLDWSREHRYPESEKWHPLEEAHTAAADYMIKVFDKQKTVDLVQ